MKLTRAKLLRISSGESQQAVARKLGTSRKTVNELENGHLDPATIRHGFALAVERLYGATIDELMQEVPRAQLEPSTGTANLP